MGQLASQDREHGQRAAGRRRLTGERTRLLAQFGLACCCLLALLLNSLHVPAQSGRQKPPPPPANSGGAQRPRTVTPQIEQSPTVPASNQPTADGRQEPPATNDDEEEVLQVSTTLVPIPATVFDAQGRVVTDLQLSDFELRVDGEVRPIGELSRAETPVKIALLFDNSASLALNKSTIRNLEKQAALRFFREVLRPVDRAAIYSVSTQPVLAHPLTNDVKALIRTIERFDEPSGATALFDAIAAAAEYLRPQTGRKVIVIVSDGTDTISNLNFDDTLARALRHHCEIYAVQTGASRNTNLRDLVGERRLEEFAAQTGGAVFVLDTAADLPNAFARIAADLAQQYILNYYPTDDSRDGRLRTFTLSVPTRKGLRVRTRRGYYTPKN
jgi:VWFA-related protein